MTRKFNSNIIVLENDRWIYKDQEIENREILGFFRKNLKEDQRGIYIENSFRELTEAGYIECRGFPLHIISFANGKFHSDGGEALEISSLDFFSLREIPLFAMKKNENFIKYRFSRQGLADISPCLQEKNDGFSLTVSGQNHLIQDFKKNIYVPQPD